MKEELGGNPGPICTAAHTPALSQDHAPWIPYLSIVCILAIIASFCSGPGKKRLLPHRHHRAGVFSLHRWERGDRGDKAHLGVEGKRDFPTHLNAAMASLSIPQMVASR